MFTINDRVSVKRHHDVPAIKGIVTAGPFTVKGEPLDIYRVKWENKEYETFETFYSTKYKYELI